MSERASKSENDKYWHGVVKEQQSSGLSLERWCKENSYSFYQVRYYKRKFASEGARECTFMEVPDDPVPNSKIRIEIDSAVIELEQGFDPQLLKAVVSTLRGLEC